MAAYQKFNSFTHALGQAVHNLGTATLKVALTNTAPLATNTVLADITQITVANGYPAGGISTTKTWTTSSGTAKLTINDETLTATGGSIGPFRYAVLYNDTAASDELIGFWDYGASVTLNSGESMTFDFDDVNGVLTVS